MSRLMSFLFGEKKSATLAKERLQFILARERVDNTRSEPDYLPALQKELLEVISRYARINPDDVKVQWERQDNIEVLQVKIELPEERR